MSRKNPDQHELDFFKQLLSTIEKEVELQKERMVLVARRSRPYIQYDDLLQPQDFPDIDSDGDFRFEEGTLYGLERAAVLIRRKLAQMP